MKKKYLFLYSILLQGYIQAIQLPDKIYLNEAMLRNYAYDIKSYILPIKQQQQSVEEKNIPFNKYRDILEKFVIAWQAQYADVPFESISIEDQKKINGAEFLLSIMQIAGLGGPFFPDDGVKQLQTLIKRFITNPKTFPAYIEPVFQEDCMHFLNLASNNVDNIFEVTFAQALLLGTGNTAYADYHRVRLLNEIVYSQEKIDSGIKNKARSLLAKILIQRNNPENNSKIYSILTDITNDTFVFPDDLQYAQDTIKKLYPLLLTAHKDTHTVRLIPLATTTVSEPEGRNPPQGSALAQAMGTS